MDSYAYQDISTGDDATPLWIPQISMALGTVIFLIAVVDETIRRMKGIPETAQEDAHHE
jgi:hypothetical protein